MSEDTSFHDPRESLTYDPEIGMVFIDAHEDGKDLEDREKLTLVYFDEDVALLRSNRQKRNSTHYRHRRPDRTTFEKQIGAGRLEQVDIEPPVDGGRLAAIKRRAEELEDEDGRKTSHYAEGLRMALTLLTDGLPGDDRETIEYTEVDGIGARIAYRLQHHDFVTKGDVRRASDEELLSVSGLGENGLENLREYVS